MALNFNQLDRQWGNTFFRESSRFYVFKSFVDRMFHSHHYDWSFHDSNVFGHAEAGKE